MGQYSFIREGNIKFSKEVVDKHIKKLQPLNYNKFMWWRTHTDKVVPLGKRAPLKDRILNGDFNPSSYFWQAQLSLYTALSKIDLTKHDQHRQMEMLAVDLARYKRLMQDYEKEEPARRTTPAENRKNNRRGRPKKEKIQVVSNQPKGKRGRPKKYV
jgi:hypothetical protein